MYNVVLLFDLAVFNFLLSFWEFFSLQRNWEMLKRRTSRSMPLWTRPWASSIVSKTWSKKKKKKPPLPFLTPSSHLASLCLHIWFCCFSDPLFSRSTGGRAHQANQQKCGASRWFEKYFNVSGALIKLHCSSPQKIPSDFRNNLL